MKRNLFVVLGLLLSALGGWKLYLLDRNGFYGDADVAYAVLAGFAVVIGVGLLLHAIKNPDTSKFTMTSSRALSFVVGIFALFWLIVAAFFAKN